MTLAGLVFANLFRHPLRTGLAFVSLVVTFVLLVLLRSVSAIYADAAEASDPRLIVMAKYRSAYMLPVAHAEQIRQLEHVTTVTPMVALAAYYQQPRNTFLQYAVFPTEYLHISDEFSADSEALARMGQIRAGALVSEALVADFGWNIGDRVMLESTVYPKRDGSRAWEFEIAGILTPLREPGPQLLLFNYDYYTEATLYNRTVVGLIAAGVDQPTNVPSTMRAIDAWFANSPQPTRTYTVDHLNRSFGRQIGNIGAMVNYILAATFFTVLLVTGNVTAQSIRARRKDVAMMKCFGFPDHVLVRVTLAESIVLFVAAAACASLLALLLESFFNRSLGTYLGELTISWRSIGLTGVFAVAGGALVGAWPAFTAARLNICDGLRRA